MKWQRKFRLHKVWAGQRTQYVKLAFKKKMTDDASNIVDNRVSRDPHDPSVGVDFNFENVTTVGISGAVGVMIARALNPDSISRAMTRDLRLIHHHTQLKPLID